MMTTDKFKKIKKAYKKEHKRWLNLEVGQFVCIEIPRFIEIEYFLCVITDIDVDNRKVNVIDFSRDEKTDTISNFLTIEELEKQGIQLNPFSEREIEVSEELKRNHKHSYACDRCNAVHILDQSKICEMTNYVMPHGCHGGDYHTHDHYYFICDCSRPIEVKKEHVMNPSGLPTRETPHAGGRCIDNR